jgi:hypothetical protein
LYDEPAMVEQEGAQSRELLAASGPARAAVKATGYNVAVAGILVGDCRINSQDSSVQIGNPEKHFLKEARIVGEG